jgi:UDP-N-acetylglucosamine acyltransferase
MSAEIHSTAIIDPSAELAAGVVVGPYAVVGPEVSIGARSEIGAGAQLAGPTRMGVENRVFPHACIGFDPQDLKFHGEKTRLEVGDRNLFREFATVNRGTEAGGGYTSIGSDNLFMAYTHVAHDCHVGNRTIFSNGATLAGHVLVEDDAVVGAFSAVHQFCRVGRHAYIGGYSVISQDALPFVKTVGNKPACYGVNSIGLRRKGFDNQTLKTLDRAVRVLLRSGLNTTQALDRLREEFSGTPEIDYLIAFVSTTQRGIIKTLPGRRTGRGVGTE